MKNLFLLFLSLFLYVKSSGQIKIKGRVLSITIKELSEVTPHKIISENYPTMAFFHLSDKKFFVNGSVNSPVYKLGDKDTVTINGEMVISYLSTINNELKMIAASEINGSPNKIKIAIFDMGGDKRYVEYLCKIGN